MDEPILLSGHTVELRMPQESDVLENNWHHWYNDYSRTRYNNHGVFPLSRRQELAFVQAASTQSDSIMLAVVEKATQRLLGNVSLQNIDLLNRRCYLSITLGEDSPITANIEAFGLMTEHAFMRLNMNRVEAMTHENLLTLVDMMSIFGYVKEGRGRKYFLKDNKWADSIMFSVLADEYFACRAARNNYVLFKTQDELYDASKAALRDQ